MKYEMITTESHVFSIQKIKGDSIENIGEYVYIDVDDISGNISEAIKGFDCSGENYVIWLSDNRVKGNFTETDLDNKPVKYETLGDIKSVCICKENIFIGGTESLGVINSNTAEQIYDLPAIYDITELVSTRGLILANRSDGIIMMLENSGKLIAAHLPTVCGSMPFAIGVNNSEGLVNVIVSDKKVNNKDTIIILKIWD